MKTQNRKADFAANQLIDEKSPYLLQHAYNPVKWRPWEDEVFLEARRKLSLIHILLQSLLV